MERDERIAAQMAAQRRDRVRAQAAATTEHDRMLWLTQALELAVQTGAIQRARAQKQAEATAMWEAIAGGSR